MILRSIWNNHYKSGIIIGSIYILCNIMLFIFKVYRLIIRYEHKEEIMLTCIEMGFCLLSALISGLYIMAVKKKCHTFMRPGLMVFFFDFYYSSKVLFLSCLKSERNNASDVFMFTLYSICVCMIAIQIAIFWSSYILYSQIRSENLGKSEAVIRNQPLPK